MYYYFKDQNELAKLVTYPPVFTRYEKPDQPKYGFCYQDSLVYYYKPFTDKNIPVLCNMSKMTIYPNMLILQVMVMFIIE